MGDYTANGIKIGTSGQAYYATKSMLEAFKLKYPTDIETKRYLNPKNKCLFAFPYPEFDNKEVGEISIFHMEPKDLQIIEIDKTNKTFHKKIVHHVHPVGGQGINLFCDCPYHSTENVSRNFSEETIKFYLEYQTFTGVGDEMAIVGECIYCGETNVFEPHEAEEVAKNLNKQAEWNEEQSKRREYENTANKEKHLKEAIKLRKIALRVLQTYNI